MNTLSPAATAACMHPACRPTAEAEAQLQTLHQREFPVSLHKAVESGFGLGRAATSENGPPARHPGQSGQS
jgi:hypothetical protein